MSVADDLQQRLDRSTPARKRIEISVADARELIGAWHDAEAEAAGRIQAEAELERIAANVASDPGPMVRAKISIDAIVPAKRVGNVVIDALRACPAGGTFTSIVEQPPA